MDRIALISVHSDPNYGSMLQAYALAKAIKREGKNAEYINYVGNGSSIFLIRLARKTARVLLDFFRGKKTEYENPYSDWRLFYKQKILFRRFHRNRIPISAKVYNRRTIADANNRYDCFIVGSDQTWSPKIPESTLYLNCLLFSINSVRCCAYAPSLGTTSIPHNHLEFLTKSISRFDYLSCREKTNAIVLSHTTGRKVSFVLDPTLLLSKDEWLSIAEPIDMPRRFILCYVLGEKQCIYDFADWLGVKKELPVFSILTRAKFKHRNNLLNPVSVPQFLTLLSNASYIITDSFHGCMFSINFNKEFYAFRKRESSDGLQDNDRIGEVLSSFNIIERLKQDGEMSECPSIDYDVVNNTLSQYKKASLSFLKKTIE